MFKTLGNIWKRTARLVTGVGLDNDAALRTAFGGVRRTTSDVEVTQSTAMTVSSVYAAVYILSWAPAQLPIKTFRREPNGDKEPVFDHPVTRLLQKRPNPDMTASAFRNLGQVFRLLWGNSFSYIERDGAGQPVNLWPLHAGDVEVGRLDNGQLIYDISRAQDKKGNVTQVGGWIPTAKRTLFDFEVLHVPGLGFNGIVGQSVLSFAAEQLGEAIASQRFAGGFFGGGAQPIYALKHPGKLGTTTGEKLREQWGDVHGGPVRKIAVLEEDMSIETIGMPLVDAQFLESRKFSVEEVARWFNLPPHKLRDLTNATFSNIHEQKVEFQEDLLPHLTAWEDEYNRKLFREIEQQSGLFVEHILAGLLKGDITQRFAAYATALQNGWMNRNEVRKLENLNNMGTGGDIYTVQVNMQDVDRLSEPPEPEPTVAVAEEEETNDETETD